MPPTCWSPDRYAPRSCCSRALTADLNHSPAHNNLGVVDLGQQKLYKAASEAEWAKKLIPGHPDLRVNLGLLMEDE